MKLVLGLILAVCAAIYSCAVYSDRPTLKVVDIIEQKLEESCSTRGIVLSNEEFRAQFTNAQGLYWRYEPSRDRVSATLMYPMSHAASGARGERMLSSITGTTYKYVYEFKCPSDLQKVKPALDH